MTMNKLLFAAWLTSVCVMSGSAAADSGSTQSSIDQMKKLMTNPAERNAAIANDPEARAADQKAADLGSPAVKEKTYAIAADIASTMAAKDPVGFGNSADSLKTTDPKALYDSLTAEQKAAIERLAKEIESARK